MLPSERIELNIYKRIKPLGPGPVTVDLAMLHQATNEEYQTIVERLMSLEAEGQIAIHKYIGQVRYSFADWARRPDFFYDGSFCIDIVPQERKYFEELEQRDEQEHRQPLVFISCGQFSQKERESWVKLLKGRLTGYRPHAGDTSRRIKAPFKPFPITSSARWISAPDSWL